MELTNSAWSVIDHYYQAFLSGRMTQEEARAAAASQVSCLRYGREGKDYFWITDMRPVMVMHPYRPDLNGHNLSDFSDPDGVRLFVEFVKKVAEHGHGYVDYVWQWKDDPARMEAKESYVRGFEPWGWIVGTGIYLEDVRLEISTITRRLVDVCAVILACIGGLLLYTAQQSFQIEKRRRSAECDLRLSHEKYQALVEASTEGTLLVLNNRCAYANQPLLDLLGYSSDEILFLLPEDLFEQTDKASGMLQESGQDSLAGCEMRVRHKSGHLIDTLVSGSRIDLAGRHGLILVLKDLRSHKVIRSNLEDSLRSLQASLLFLNEPVSSCMSKFLSVPLETPVSEAAFHMSEKHGSAVCVATESGDPLGIVTDRDIRDRIVARRLNPSVPVREIMTSPLCRVTANALIHEALFLFNEHNVSHLLVCDSQEKALGLLSYSDLMRFHSFSASSIMYRINRADNSQTLAGLRSGLIPLAKDLISAGAKPHVIARTVTSISDSVAARLTELALAELGPSPLPFAFFSIGSEGREEQTLFTDQDNALIYADPPPELAEECSSYFLELGRRICGGLSIAGYTPCPGDSMASNPSWNLPLQKWTECFERWIIHPDSRELINFGIFFDFRIVYGDSSLSSTLRTRISSFSSRNHAFLHSLSREILAWREPLNFFGNLVTDDSHNLDLKELMMQIVHFSRLYALRHDITLTGTVARLNSLSELDRRSRDDFLSLIQGFEFLLMLRFRSQICSPGSCTSRVNNVDPRTLTPFELSSLKQVVEQIRLLKSKVAYDFPGASST
ncbi:MAG: DUF294 nucleotidyltransferase-like domain-containing protein [Candidatus Wallbacteria bacterium]|nr:DUF294 nucleotidyltransferase-like domain-containing protein [Candidatus Wallbacteria bacterium]